MVVKTRPLVIYIFCIERVRYRSRHHGTTTISFIFDSTLLGLYIDGGILMDNDEILLKKRTEFSVDSSLMGRMEFLVDYNPFIHNERVMHDVLLDIKVEGTTITSSHITMGGDSYTNSVKKDIQRIIGGLQKVLDEMDNLRYLQGSNNGIAAGNPPPLDPKLGDPDV